MIENDVIEKVYEALTRNPQRSPDLAQKLRLQRGTVKLALTVLKRQGRAERLDKTVELAHGYRTQRSFWVKT